MHGEDRPNIKTQLNIGALKLAEFPDHILIDYGHTWDVGSAIFRPPPPATLKPCTDDQVFLDKFVFARVYDIN